MWLVKAIEYALPAASRSSRDKRTQVTASGKSPGMDTQTQIYRTAQLGPGKIHVQPGPNFHGQGTLHRIVLHSRFILRASSDGDPTMPLGRFFQAMTHCIT